MTTLSCADLFCGAGGSSEGFRQDVDGEPRVVSLDFRRDPDFVPPRIAATLVATAYVRALANDRPTRPPLKLPRVRPQTTTGTRRVRAGC